MTVSDNTSPAYSFADSLTGGVPFVWEDISASGVRLALSDIPEGEETVTIASFAFPFYGQNYSAIHVTSMGLLSFESGSVDSPYAFINDKIPSPVIDGSMIAPFWDDLDVGIGGEIFVKNEADRLIIQFDDISRLLTHLTSC